MTTETTQHDDKFIALDNTLPCGCVIKLVRTIDSFHGRFLAPMRDDYELNLTFCPLHEAAEALRNKCLDVKTELERAESARVVARAADKKETP